MTGLEVKQILMDRGISISKCARDIGINTGVLNSVLNDKKPFYPKYRMLLAEYLSLDIPAEEQKLKDAALIALLPILSIRQWN